MQSRRTTNGRERLSLHFELRSMCTFRSDDSVFAGRARSLAPTPNEKCSRRLDSTLSRRDNLNKMKANKTLLIYTRDPHPRRRTIFHHVASRRMPRISLLSARDNGISFVDYNRSLRLANPLLNPPSVSRKLSASEPIIINKKTVLGTFHTSVTQ